MDEQQTAANSNAPIRVSLEEFVEAVTRGALRALAAEQADEVSGYSFNPALTPTTALNQPALQPSYVRGPIIIGFPPIYFQGQQAGGPVVHPG